MTLKPGQVAVYPKDGWVFIYIRPVRSWWNLWLALPGYTMWFDRTGARDLADNVRNCALTLRG